MEYLAVKRVSLSRLHGKDAVLTFNQKFMVSSFWSMSAFKVYECFYSL